jgi:dihydroorotate dehydrogenase
MVFFINPPFGNYVKLPHLIPIRGSFTLEPRSGLLWQIVKTLRFDFSRGVWINKIGLRNKGIDYAIKTYKHSEEIISIAILDEKEIPFFIEKIPVHMNLEINVSCPNTEHSMVSKGISVFLNPNREWCIVKLSPVIKFDEIDNLYNEGFRQFHCCNTYPTERGGMSGHVLYPYNARLIRYIREKYKDECTIIAGGGIRGPSDISEYQKLGADHFGFSTVCFNPIRFAVRYYNILTIKQ